MYTKMNQFSKQLNKKTYCGLNKHKDFNVNKKTILAMFKWPLKGNFLNPKPNIFNYL